MKYNSIMSLTNLNGKLIRSTEDERQKLLKCMMHVTEKIDGENWRLGIVEGKKVIGGRKHLFFWDETTKEFTHDHTHKPHPNWTKINEETKEEILNTLDTLKKRGYDNVIFYGELYGNDLQGRFKFDHEGYAVIYYEIAIGDKYLDQKEAFAWFVGFGLKMVPYMDTMTLKDFLNVDVEGLKSSVTTSPFIEGLVGVPVGGNYEWDFADRFVVKKKIKKFAEQKQKDPEKSKKKRYVSPFSQFVVENRLRHVLDELEQDGHFLSGDKEFRLLVVEKMLENIQNEENNGEDFESNDRKALANETHRLFSIYSSKI